MDVVEEFVREPLGALVEIEAGAPWQQTEVLRYDRYVPERRLGAWLRPETSTLLRQTGLHLEATYRVPLDGVAALLYRDGNDFQGLHSDRELRWLEDTRIAIVVLGPRRPFVFRPRGSWAQAAAERVPAGAGPDDIVLTPGEGDLLVMGGACQRDWLHGVPAMPGIERPRVSLTWRWTSRRGRPDTAATYYDGRQFSDGTPRPPTRSRPVI
ncbi:MAG: alpha-ketoglutarate-dependent dioxygenase AlkB [Acidimicrobiales bacterium]